MKNFITLLFLSIGTIYGQTFTDIEAGLPSFYNSISAFGDIDGDGDLDLYLSGDSEIGETGGLYIYDADTSSYALLTSDIPSLAIGSARWGDIDNDGDIDLLLQGYDNPSGLGITDVYLNNDGVFAALNLGLPPSYMGEVAFVDLNNDTFLDIAITGLETVGWTTITKIFTNNGDLSFSELTLDLPGMSFGRIKFADYNNDDYQDFILSGWEDTFYVKIFTNNQDETFSLTDILLEQNWIGDTEWVDYNADGNIDLIVTGTGGAGDIRSTNLYKNNGDGTFTDVVTDFENISHSSIECADFDNDGDVDILLVGTKYDPPSPGDILAYIYNNDGGDVFTLSESAILTGSYYGDADAGDIDGDGEIDLVISGYDENGESKSTVYKNTTSLTVGINDKLLTDFSIYPNPSTDKKITLSFDSIGTQDNEITIYTLTGTKVFYSKIVNAKEIDLSNLNAGIYMVEINSDNKMAARKLILE